MVETAQYAERRDALAQDWPQFLAEILPGAVLLPVPNNPSLLGAWLRTVQPRLIVLSSGNDWGEAPERDRVEVQLIDHALAEYVPLFGVCRGLQALNLHFGGQVAKLGPEHGNHVAANHEVRIEGDAFRELAQGETTTVNSYHNIGLIREQVAAPLVTFAITESGVVEGLSHRHAPLLAVQWHPERWPQRDSFGSRLLARMARDGMFWSGSPG